MCSIMDGPRDYHTKQSKSERQIQYNITYRWNLKYDINEHIYKTDRLTDIENRLVVAKVGSRYKGGKYWEFGISRCNLLYIG